MTASCSGQAAVGMSEATSSGNKPSLDIFIPKQLGVQCKNSRRNADDVGRHVDTGGQSSSFTLKPQCQSAGEAAGDSSKQRTLQTTTLADACATNQLSNEFANREWTKEQLRLLHRTLTKKLQLEDMRSKVMARADSGVAVLQQSSAKRFSSVSQLPGLPRKSGSVHRQAAIKTDIMAADTAANDKTTSLVISAGMTFPSQDSAAERTERTSAKVPCDSHRSENSSTSDTSSTASQHKESISATPERQHLKGRSDKPGGSHQPQRQASHKSHRHHRSPNQIRRTARNHSSSPSKLTKSAAKRKRCDVSVYRSPYTEDSPSVAKRSRGGTSVSQSPAVGDWSTAKVGASDRPKRGKRSTRRRRRARLLNKRSRSSSRHRSPCAVNRTPLGKAFVEASLRERHHAQASELLSSQLSSTHQLRLGAVADAQQQLHSCSFCFGPPASSCRTSCLSHRDMTIHQVTLLAVLDCYVHSLKTCFIAGEFVVGLP